uniref:tRNA methyl transferase PRC-barrel domain-containing protein n=1 Tax=Alistipes putredinis TaxID=28117 RepID=UPI003FD7E9A8
MKDNRVLLGFSGGIDSFAAVGLLQAAGYHVTALTLDMRGDSALLEKARLRAGTLGIPWRMRSVRERFEREVVDYFTDSYFRGRTPAPCTRCNSRIKWPCLAAEADALGIRHIATGHYFCITSAGGKRYVTRAADNRKDQSYYLWDLPQEILDRVLTPMGTVIKRNIVEGLADRRESMGVCFLEGRPCRDFLRSRDKTEALRPGPIIDAAGHRLGTHDGAALYTIGQKKGLNLPPGWAVVAIDTAANRIVAGEEKLLLHRTLEVGECRLVESDEVFGARDIRAVIRGIGRNPEGYAAVSPAASGIRIELEDPAWAPAVGQPVVLYRGERVVGGGILERYY